MVVVTQSINAIFGLCGLTIVPAIQDQLINKRGDSPQSAIESALISFDAIKEIETEHTLRLRAAAHRVKRAFT